MRRPKDPEAFKRAQESRARITERPLPANVVSFEAFAAQAPKKRKGLRGAGKNEIGTSLEEVGEMRAKGEWKSARPRHFVALYWQLHQHVYKLAPAELRGREWTAACLAAKRMIDVDFQGDLDRFVEFIVWTWRREKYLNAKDESGTRRRLGWRLQFSPSLATDYRLHLQRQRELPHHRAG